MYNHIKWHYGVTGYLSEKEKEHCLLIDGLLDSCEEDVYVVITIEGGNQFHIYNGEKRILNYMTAEQCKYAIMGMLAMKKGE